MKSDIEISILPERRRESGDKFERVKVRVWLVMTGESKEAKQELGEIWDQLETDSSTSALLKLIGRMDKRG